MAPGVNGDHPDAADAAPSRSGADPPARRYEPDDTWHRVASGELLAGSPLRLFRVTPGGARVLDRVEAGDAMPPNALIDRLLDAGAAHPVLDPAREPTSAAYSLDDVTVVTPRYRTGDGDERVDGASAGDGALEWIVVDDASPAPVDGATVRLDRNRGPAAARNAGRTRVTTPLIAFVDDDVDLPHGSDWLAALLLHFDDPRVGLVAPRVTGDPTSSLDLGDRPARIRSGTRVSYVPAATIVVRADAFDDVGGFDEQLRFGEDVDLVWRLDQAGWRCRYEPGVTVDHRPRPTWSGRIRQQIGYGSAAAPLALRHPGELAPWRGDLPLAVLAVASVAGLPRVGLGALAAQLARVRRRLPTLAVADLFGLAVRADVDAARHLAQAIRRAWWPIALVLSVPSRPVRRALVTSLLASPRTALLDAAYGWGVWSGARRLRTIRPLMPRLHSMSVEPR